MKNILLVILCSFVGCQSFCQTQIQVIVQGLVSTDYRLTIQGEENFSIEKIINVKGDLLTLTLYSGSDTLNFKGIKKSVLLSCSELVFNLIDPSSDCNQIVLTHHSLDFIGSRNQEGCMEFNTLSLIQKDQ